METDSDVLIRDLGFVCLSLGVACWIVKTVIDWFGKCALETEGRTRSFGLVSRLRALPSLFLLLPTRLFDQYRESRTSTILETLQPLTLVLAVVGFLVTSYGLWITSEDIKRQEKEAHATLRMMLDDRLAEATVDPDVLEWECVPEIPKDGGALARMVQSMAALGVPLDRVRGVGVPLSGVNLDDSQFDYAVLSLSDLRYASFSGARLHGSELFCADLEFAEFVRAELSEADFRLANLRSADFSGSVFSGVDFSGAVLSGAVFSGVDLSSTEFLGACVDGADFRGATGLTRERIESACLRDEKNLPKGLPAGWMPPASRSCPDQEISLFF